MDIWLPDSGYFTLLTLIYTPISWVWKCLPTKLLLIIVIFANFSFLKGDKNMKREKLNCVN